ncbi:MAG: SPOR domain-containing protein [Leptospiraceae bacterium]|nr:SPOR domain-containing protein [Leptospiraceae bacterium]MCB1201023.1 SPOR domain-containing protein [Leptospiraceae bacterium]
MRNIYVLNLDQKRLIIVAGVALSLIGSAIFAGMSIARASSIENSGEAPILSYDTQQPPIETIVQANVSAQEAVPQIENKPANEKVIVKLDSDPMLPVLEQKNGIENTTSESVKVVEKDPFITPPPTRKTETKKEVRSSEKHYVIQIAAFKQENQARSLVKKLKSDGFSAHVERGTMFWFVRLGASSDPKNLQSRADKLKKSGYEALIRKI